VLRQSSLLAPSATRWKIPCRDHLAREGILKRNPHGSAGAPAFFIPRNYDSLALYPCDDVPSLFYRLLGWFSEFSSPSPLDTMIKLELDFCAIKSIYY